MKKFIAQILILSSVILSSCGGSSESKVTDVKNDLKPSTEIFWEEFTIQSLGNTMMDMKFDISNITVKEDSWVRINLVNKGSDPAMIHNILIVNFNKRSDLAMAALEAGPELDYHP